MMNKVFLLGRLTRNPEMRKTESGKKVVRFTLAVKRRKASEDGKDADFIDCVAWEKLAEIIFEHCPKGRQILVVGRLQERSFEDKEGKRRYVTEVVVEDMEFVGRKNENGQTEEEQAKEQETAGNGATEDEELDEELEKFFEEDKDYEGGGDDSPEDDLPF